MTELPSPQAFADENAEWIVVTVPNTSGIVNQFIDISAFDAVRPVAMQALLVTDATVLNRLILWSISGGNLLAWQLGNVTPLPAISARGYMLGRGYKTERAGASNDYVPIWSPVIEQPSIFTVGISNGAAGDVLSAIRIFYQAWPSRRFRKGK